MTPLKVLKAAVAEFERRGVKYCLVGGHAASLYRKNERLTKDVDFAILADPQEKSLSLAEDVIKSLGFKSAVGFFSNSNRMSDRSIKMVTSKPTAGASTGVIDILLPALPWVEDSVERAQYNKMDLIFAKVPVITPEDLIVAKVFSVSNSPTRFQDLDDLKEILTAELELDFEYLKLKFEKFDLTIPVALKEIVPKKLLVGLAS